MLKAALPRPTATRKRVMRRLAVNCAQRSRKGVASRGSAARARLRGSCFHTATTLMNSVATAAPCTTRTSVVCV
jgi:hypothetical protein